MNSKTSMQDIADKLGISKNAVSLALNNKAGVSEELRFRIFEAANQLNYRTDTKTKKKRGNLLVLIPENIRNDKIFYYEVFWSIEKRAKENGYNAIICSVTQEMEDQLILPELYHEIEFHGILLVGVLHLNYVRKLFDLGIPLVTVDHYYDSLQFDAVVTANAEEAYKIVTHLIDKGHQQIGFIGAISRTKSFRERWSGYQNAMSDAGLAIDMNHNIVNPSPLEALNSTPIELADHLDAMPSMPTAWFCADDRIAISFIQILISKGYKVPEDISVVGFGDIEAAQMIAPRLTTIQVQREQLGNEAVDFLIRKIDFGGSPAKISIYGELIERDSCKVLG
ncbi:DNA-binding LacI/PurR family transcriptional regulator [Paenibacillus sp. V4I3]|uniref:LacI family DNA-binding transcriptional regulator n=1 Tax=unclassified Paenibacillus TaxID=185978 RepID=UPI002786CA60|nr:MULTISPECIES: LacI family DNA-binding transcriptional regulator [unclassified Paenibacillus]MDQ0872813.1 DNA-binding LacI/PurR family transcriptional regulator [Paenibacillus sp. V4I3]MDQ0891268.1 DNA-binding LacI/PurR family transcriptional regulator [Paenibacillus sp. V4I9]